MKYYFDHRNYTDSFVKVIADDTLLGYAFLKKNKITCISIPEGTKRVELWYSFTKFENCEKIRKDVYDADYFSFKVKNISQKHRKDIDDEWKFPYYAVIDTEKYHEDAYFYPTVFTDDALQGALLYQGVVMQSGEKMNMTLKKDICLGVKIERIRKKNILQYTGLIGLCIILFPITVPRMSSENLGYYEQRFFGYLFYGAIIFLLYGIMMLQASVRYWQMLNFSKLPDEMEL